MTALVYSILHTSIYRGYVHVYWPRVRRYTRRRTERLSTISSLIFLNPIPLKVPELAIYACFDLIHLSYTESTWSQTLRQLSQLGVRLHINWVNAEWDSMSTESTQMTPTFTKILSFRVDSVDVESHSMLTQLTWSLTWHWLSLRGMRLRVNWPLNVKKFE